MRSRSLAVRAVIRAMSGVISVTIALGGSSAATGWVHRVLTGSAATRQTGGAGPAFATRWRFGQVPLPAEVAAIGSVSCGSPNICLAVGFTAGEDSVLLRSTDGGLHWAEGQGRTPVGSFAAVSCVSPTRCMATTTPTRGSAGSVVTSTNGGVTWHLDGSFPAIKAGDLRLVRCVTTAVCYIFNADAHSYLTGGIERTADFGGHWATQHVTGPDASAINAIDSASCPTASTCVVVAEWSQSGNSSPLLQTSDAGSTWTVRVAPTHAADLDAVSCGSAMDCLAAGGGEGHGPDAVASSDGGVTWTATARPAELGLAFGVTCTAAMTCLLAAETGGIDLANNGLIASTTDLGGHWTVTRTTPHAGFPVSISCPTASHCVAARESDGDFLPTVAKSEGFFVNTAPSATWRQVDLPLALADLQSVSCPAGSVCYAAGGTSGAADEATVLRSADGGNTWRTVLLTRRMQTFSGISCPTATECVAVGTLNFGTGNGVARTDDAGRHWQIAGPPAGIENVTGISCPTAAFCEALGRIAHGRTPSRLLRSTDGGRHWTVTRPPAGVAYLLDLSCPTSQVCTAVGDAVHPPSPAVIIRTADGGAHWIRQKQPRGATVISAVSCADARDCAAFSDTETASIDVTHDGGARWTVQHLTGMTGHAEAPTIMSCATPRRCAFVAMSPFFSGAVIQTANGHTWRKSVMPAGTEWLLGISCDKSRCVATGIDGQVLISH